MHPVGPRVLNFHLFRSTTSHFQDIAQFTIFMSTLMSKFQICFSIYLIAKKVNPLYSTMVVNVFMKFAYDHMKTVGGVF